VIKVLQCSAVSGQLRKAQRDYFRPFTKLIKSRCFLAVEKVAAQKARLEAKDSPPGPFGQILEKKVICE
jgi:hypothetical protein